MIPKVIHYCWFGHNEKPKLNRKCIASWKKRCPDYRIIEWNEDNCDFSSAPLFVTQAIAVKKWGFVSDYFRYKIVYENGGIYLDTDVELLKSLDSLLDDSVFFGFHNGLINSGHGFGAEKGAAFLLELMEIYETTPFIQSDSTLDLRPCTVKETPVFLKHGLIQDDSEQILDHEIHIYPKEYFDPGNWGSFFVYKTDKTVSIHRYQSSWYSKKDKIKYACLKWKDLLIHLPNYIFFTLLGKEKYMKLKKRIRKRTAVLSKDQEN